MSRSDDSGGPISLWSAVVSRWNRFKQRVADGRIEGAEFSAIMFGFVCGGGTLLILSVLFIWGALALVKCVLKTIF